MSNQNFILIKDTSSKITEFLIQRVIGFADSDEYHLLDDDDRKYPGIVCGAFASYICRINGQGGETDVIIDNAFEVIESLCLTQYSDVEDYIVTEILENINFYEYPELIGKLKHRSKLLYDRWLT